MKKIVLLAATSILFAGAASAADLAARPYTKAPVAPVAVYNWTGFYVGINGGGGSARKCWDLTNNAGVPVNPAIDEGCHDATGATAGGQVGYRWQASTWVFGVEAQGNWANFKGSNLNQAPQNLAFRFTDQSRVEAFGLFTGQVGYAVNNVLFYAKGGAAVVNDKYNNLGGGVVVPVGVVFSEGTETRWGGVAGVGIEFGFAPNWSVAAEYDHLFMGTKNVGLNLIPPVAAGPASFHNIRQDVDVGTIRLNYRFGGPVVAKY
ncbi:outer membrane beta-barrel protein [Bradyrhizobium sp.]|uniref:outer membrane protein n=1 Tax=Bradyrhizobium sp. TaxID=376 RepID=UPI001DDFB179|nr:outer membrane beta-barrel protein [Bradyrhizobium sp.]MBI5320713.1 porin family protein [Bradyrhizobium sp.]